jgi:hypothetical protein
VDGAAVEDDLATALAAGDVADDEPGIAGFCAASFDLAASTPLDALDAHWRWHRAEE